ncbi:MAG TPA: beta-galactosidase GalB [Candidatus Sumerlaeota bacterium]|nr:beta-galactosidase GalB [Candidatus Sumerlaeota bacterium]
MKNLLGALLIASVCLPASGFGREVSSFDSDWKFQRFGPMPDKTTLPEPGGKQWLFPVSASSSEESKGNLPELAFDGDKTTRWCAEGGAPKQSLTIDLKTPVKLGTVKVSWELPLAYQYVVEGSADNKDWKVLSDQSKNDKKDGVELKVEGEYRYLRIQTTGLPGGKWASITEVELTDADGKAIVNKLEATAGVSAEAVAFDDSKWRSLSVPHDWGIEGPFRDDLDNNTGKLPWRGIGWYRKHFEVPASDQGKRVFLDFDGAMANAQIWLNGEYVGTWPYGYNSFRMDLTPYLKFGAKNVLAVRLDTVNWDSRWYPGAGIYRHVRMVKADPVHVGLWGTYVTTPEITDAAGKMKMAVTVENQSKDAVEAKVQTDVFEYSSKNEVGAKVASCEESTIQVPAGGCTTATLAGSVAKPKRWDTVTPNRYLARTVVSVGGKEVDAYDTPFGFRTLEFTARDGFKLNGKRLEVYGTCNHHDLGALGAAVNLRATERQLEILKEMGDNALRTSHNPPSPELLELADRMGFLVFDEAFDCWKHGKVAKDYNKLYDAWHVKDLQAMVRRDRNHPSVFMWSIGNEILEQRQPEFSKHLAAIVHAQDPTRPVSAGCNDANGAIDSGFAKYLDVMGINYNLPVYARFLKHPDYLTKPLYGSETSSCISSRGEYFFPVKRGRDAEANFQVTSYDVDAPGWAYPPDDQFKTLDENPAAFGEFVWTGFDYLGEPTPYGSDVTNLLNFQDPAQKAQMQKQLEEIGKIKVPSRSSYFGIVDLAGFPKDRYYIYQARWRPDLPMAHLLPHWNWPERVGQVTPVHLYTSGDEAELFLNGQSLGRKKMEKLTYRIRWDDVVYQPGELKVVAYKNGKKWAEDTVKTSGEAAAVAMTADRSKVTADGQDLSFVTVRITDKAGLTVPRSKNRVKFKVEGPAEIAGVDNGDATSFESFQASQRLAYNGLCLVILRTKAGETGKVRLTAESEGLKGTEITLETVK